MINIEVLFPEVGNLFGDLGNIDYLKRVSDEINIIEDDLVSEPFFAKNVPDMIYMGTMTESSQHVCHPATHIPRRTLPHVHHGALWGFPYMAP